MQAWIDSLWNNPAQAAWYVFALLTLIVTIYHRAEPRIKALAARTTNKYDDKFVSFMGAVLSAITVFLDAAKMVAPKLASVGPTIPAVKPQPKKSKPRKSKVSHGS